jgi:hypothetical protein
MRKSMNRTPPSSCWVMGTSCVALWLWMNSPRPGTSPANSCSSHASASDRSLARSETVLDRSYVMVSCVPGRDTSRMVVADGLHTLDSSPIQFERSNGAAEAVPEASVAAAGSALAAEALGAAVPEGSVAAAWAAVVLARAVNANVAAVAAAQK